jgi:hypothetical protein
MIANGMAALHSLVARLLSVADFEFDFEMNNVLKFKQIACSAQAHPFARLIEIKRRRTRKSVLRLKPGIL